MHGLRVAQRQNHVRRLGPGDLRQRDDAHVAQELPHGLVLRRQRFQFRTESRTERVGERDHGQRVADRHHVETRRAFGDDADDLIDLLLAALDQSGGHDRCSVRLDLVEGHRPCDGSVVTS